MKNITLRNFLLLIFSVLLLFFYQKIKNNENTQAFNSPNRNGLPKYKTINPINTNELTKSKYIYSSDYYKNWFRSNSNNESIRYSSLDQINKSNVKNLKVAFTFHSGHPENIQANPVVINKKAFFPIGDDYLGAINAKTGELIWKIKTASKPAFRGLTYWQGDKDHSPRLYFPAGNNLWAISPENGNPIMEFGDKGKAGSGKSLVAPIISNGVIAYPTILQKKQYPKIDGLDVLTGKKIWSTQIAEENDSKMKGGNPWSGISSDDRNGILFVVTGDAHPEGIGISRPGKNKFANSVIALNIKNGKILWCFQEIEHDLWDKDIAAPPVVTTIKRFGEKIDVVVVPTKMGNTIILDRYSGKPIFPWRLRLAPESKLPGEITALYQPDVQTPEPFTKQSFSYDDIANLSKKKYAQIKEKINASNIGFFPPPEENKDSIILNVSGGAQWPGASIDPLNGIMYVASNETAFKISAIKTEKLISPLLKVTKEFNLYKKNCSSCHGENREGGFGPNLINISKKMDQNEIFSTIKNGKKSMPSNTHLSGNEIRNITTFLSKADKSSLQYYLSKIGLTHHTFIPRIKDFLDEEGYPANKPPWGMLIALNLNTGKIIWKKPLGDDLILSKRGLKNVGTRNLGGAVATAGGLIFCAGTTDNMFRAFDKDSGNELWKFQLNAYGSAPPTIYEIDGKEFILLPATGGNSDIHGNASDEFIAFSL